MTFSTQIDDPSPKIDTLLSIRPRYRVRTWTTESIMGQNVYSTPYTRGNIIGVYDLSYESIDEEETYDDMIADKGTWFFDEDNEVLYANFEDVSDPFTISTNPNNRVVCVEWDMFFATRAINWFKDPRNAASGAQYWEGGLQKPPIPQQGNPDLLFGFSPVRVTDVQIVIGDDSELLEYLNDWSINSSRVKIWNCAGNLNAANISEIFVGVAGSYNLKNGIVSFEVTDPMNLIDQPLTEKFFTQGDFPNIAPSSINRPIRIVYGCVEGFIGVNVDFNETEAIDNNRDWVVCQGQSNKAQLVMAIVVGDPANTTSASKVDSAFGVRPGDSIVVEQGGIATYNIFVTTVNYTTNVIGHTTIPGRTISSGDEIRRGFVGRITLDDGEGNAYNLSYERDWVEIDFANDTKGVTLTDNFEANISGAPSIFTPGSHTIYMVVYDGIVVPKKINNIDDFCSLSANGGVLANPIGLLWGILRSEIRGLNQLVVFDQPAWVALASAMERTIGFALPQESAGSWGSWKEVIQAILQSELLRLHILVDSGVATLTITRDGPIGVADFEISQNDLLSPSWSWNYSDVYDEVNVSYNHREHDVTYFYGGDQLVATGISYVAKFLHKISNPFEIETLHYENDHAGEILEQLVAVLSERRGVLNGLLPASFLESKIGDVLNYGSKFLPGYQASGQINQRALKLQRHAKSAQGVTVTLDDQKGIEDFTGDWEP